LEPLRPFAARDLTWVHVRGWRAENHLVAGRDLFAVLRRETAFHTVAAAEAADGRWTFRRVGFFHPRVSVRPAGADMDIAIVETGKMGSGMVRFSDGRRYPWVNANSQGSEWAFTRQDGTVLVRFLVRASLRKYEGVVQVESAGRGLEELSLLLILGWYLIAISLWSARSTVTKPTHPTH